MSLLLPIVESTASEHASTRMVAVAFSVPAAAGVDHAELVAEFVSWTPLPMDRRPDGSHAITVWLEAGQTWRYRFLIDDERWIDDWNPSDDIDDEGCLAIVHT